MSWTGSCRDGTELPPLAVPLDHPGLVPAVVRRQAAMRVASGDLGPVDYLLLASLGVQYDDLTVHPIAIEGHVMSLLVIATERDRTTGGVDTIALAARFAFSRLMRDAGRA